MKLRLFLLPLLLAAVMTTHGQNNEIILNYIDKFKVLAIEEMQRTGVPASIKLAQGIHETMAGTSDLVRRSNNHFGIKCKSNWTGESVSHDDDARGECFRKYGDPADSYRDHSNFLKGSARYASLFTLDPTDYAGWAKGLKKAGYATNPKYPVIIIRLIEEYGLQDYTLIALGRKNSDDINITKKEIIKVETTQPVNAIMKTEPQEEIAVVNYPSAEFTINDTRVIYVKKGTSYLSIAQQYNVPLGRIFEFNEMTQKEVAERDQLVYLQRKRRTGKDAFHIVRAHESLRDIAQQQGMRLESLLEYNWLTREAVPAIGVKLSLQGKSGEMPRLALKENHSIQPPVKGWQK